ncbi:MAG: hypothetical protein ACKPKO_53245 [Candidatus Fonsibacter sp.]
MEIPLHIHYYQAPHLISTRLLNFRILFIFCDNVAVGYKDANDMFVARFSINKMVMHTHVIILMLQVT